MRMQKGLLNVSIFLYPPVATKERTLYATQKTWRFMSTLEALPVACRLMRRRFAGFIGFVCAPLCLELQSGCRRMRG